MQELKDRQELEAKVIAKAWENADFRNELLANPKATLEKELGIEIPEGINIKIQEEDTQNFYLTIPLNPASVELNDDMLEAVAGGACCGGQVVDGTQEQGGSC